MGGVRSLVPTALLSVHSLPKIPVHAVLPALGRALKPYSAALHRAHSHKIASAVGSHSSARLVISARRAQADVHGCALCHRRCVRRAALPPLNAWVQVGAHPRAHVPVAAACRGACRQAEARDRLARHRRRHLDPHPARSARAHGTRSRSRLGRMRSLPRTGHRVREAVY